MYTNDRDPELISHVIYVTCLRLKEAQALEYLEDKGFPISAATYYRVKKQIEESAIERLNLIASQEFLQQHLQRLDTLKTVLNEMWIQYHGESNPFKKVQILEKIEENQDYLSSYYDSTRWVLEQAAKLKQKKVSNSSQ